MKCCVNLFSFCICPGRRAQMGSQQAYILEIQVLTALRLYLHNTYLFMHLVLVIHVTTVFHIFYLSLPDYNVLFSQNIVGPSAGFMNNCVVSISEDISYLSFLFPFLFLWNIPLHIQGSMYWRGYTHQSSSAWFATESSEGCRYRNITGLPYG